LNAQAILNLLAGKKTYSTVVVAGVLLFGSWQHWWVIPDNAMRALELLALCFIKSGVAREQKRQAQAALDSKSSINQPAATQTPPASS
jgi:hypothetical protein